MQEKKHVHENDKDKLPDDFNTRYRRLFEAAQDGILILDGNTGEITDVNPYMMKILGYTRDEFLGKQLWEVGFFKDIDASRTAFQELKQNNYIRYEDLPLKTKEGLCIAVEFVSNVYLVDDIRVIQCNIRNITDRKQAQEEIAALARFPSENPNPVLRLGHNGKILYANEASQKILAEWNVTLGERAPGFWQEVVSEALDKQITSIVDVQYGKQIYAFSVTPVVCANYVNLYARDETDRKRAEDKLTKLSSVVEQTTDSVFITDREGVIEYINPAFERLTGYSKEEAIGKTPRILKSGIHSAKEYEGLWTTILAGAVLQGEIINRKKNGELFNEEGTITPLRDEQGRITHFVKTSHNTTERVQRERELEAINTISLALRPAKTLDELLPIMLDETLGVMHASQGAIWLYDPAGDELRPVVTRGCGETGKQATPLEKPDEGINGLVFTTGQPFVSKEIHLDMRLSDTVRHGAPPGMGGVVVPISAGENILGTFNVNVTLPIEILPADIRLLTSLSEIAANAIQRMWLYEKTQRDAQRLAALHSIDVSINASEDLSITLNILLDQVVALLKVSAADILIYNPHTLTLDYSAGKGFRFRHIEKSHLNLGEGYAGQAALTRQTISAPDLRTVGAEYARKALLQREEFVAYYGVPLITKGKIIGVLDVFHRSLLTPNAEWLDFMEALASQAAIAIDSATLFKDLQRTNIELLQAYEKTMEGWSRAMDLRDHETEGHTQRVTDLTVRLARAMRLKDEEIVHVRRGALLHDMGKMGIPDGILLKPGPLTAEEWVIMRQHPRYAYDMLSPIVFLEPALDIPYCHHEKWDGTGYPRGLKGEQIPIAARLFAIVDVWDALLSDRPYRKAWSEDKVLEYIRSLSGTHFDPKVLKLFLEMVEITP